MLRCGLSVCACIEWRRVYTSTWYGLGLDRNGNCIIGGMYLGITCGLTQPGGFWESGEVYYRRLSCETCILCEWATSWWSYPS